MEVLSSRALLYFCNFCQTASMIFIDASSGWQGWPAGRENQFLVRSPEAVVVANSGAPTMMELNEVFLLGDFDTHLVCGGHAREEVADGVFDSRRPFIGPKRIGLGCGHAQPDQKTSPNDYRRQGDCAMIVVSRLTSSGVSHRLSSPSDLRPPCSRAAATSCRRPGPGRRRWPRDSRCAGCVA